MDAESAGPSLVEYGLATRPFPGQSVSGDHYLVRQVPGGVLVAVVDGLGHGDDAAASAQTAVETLGKYAAEPLTSLMKVCHEHLLKTRGAALSLALFNGHNTTLTWLGVGNVDGLLLRADPHLNPKRESLLVRGGVVGYHLPSLRPSILTIHPNDMLVMTTDGIRSEFTAALAVNDPPQAVADGVLHRYGKENDDALILVVRYLGEVS